MELFDSHAHLDQDNYDEDREEVISRAINNEVKYIVNIGEDIAASRKAIELAKEYEMIYAAVGVHPHEAKHYNEDTPGQLKDMAREEKVVAIGEMGLDYHYDLSDREVQRGVFRKQIRIAKELQMPIIVHNRDAHEDTLKILSEENASEAGGILHCFSGDVEMAKKVLDMGFYISLAGPVTFKKSQKEREVAKMVPENSLLIETDSPFLSPEPKRGKRNEPARVRYIAEKIAEVREESLEKVARYTTANTKRVFNI